MRSRGSTSSVQMSQNPSVSPELDLRTTSEYFWQLRIPHGTPFGQLTCLLGRDRPYLSRAADYAPRSTSRSPFCMMGVGVCAVTGAFVSQGGVQPGRVRLTLQKSAESLAANASDSSVGTRSERAERQRKRDVSTATHARWPARSYGATAWHPSWTCTLWRQWAYFPRQRGSKCGVPSAGLGCLTCPRTPRCGSCYAVMS